MNKYSPNTSNSSNHEQVPPIIEQQHDDRLFCFRLFFAKLFIIYEQHTTLTDSLTHCTRCFRWLASLNNKCCCSGVFVMVGQPKPRGQPTLKITLSPTTQTHQPAPGHQSYKISALTQIAQRVCIRIQWRLQQHGHKRRTVNAVAWCIWEFDYLKVSDTLLIPTLLILGFTAGPIRPIVRTANILI